ncbi:MAG TPA: fatty acid desaturase [Bdellovibrionota bacterium]|nr:fatty acid desaturase [Bdellovibrionota bacterium]
MGFRHSPKDAWLVGLALFQCMIWGLTLVFWDALDGWTLVPLSLLAAFLICTNFQCVAHNFIHNPFFGDTALNGAFSLVNTLCLGIPQSLYTAHHLNHHQYNNQTGDWSALHRYSKKPGTQEALWRYAIVGPIRADIGPAFKGARTLGLGSLVVAEAGLLAAVVVAAFAIHATWVVEFFLPTLYLGHILAYAENYLEHDRADPAKRMANSVSCYSSWYNRIWFNNGYHQEHHAYPRINWTRIPEARGRMLPESQRRVVKHAHWFGHWQASKS